MSVKCVVKYWFEQRLRSDRYPFAGVAPTLGSDPVGLFANGVRGDRCGSFLCSDNCTSVILPFKVITFLPESINAFVLFIAAGVLGLGWVIFALVFLQVRTFRFRTRGKLHKGKDNDAFNLQAVCK